MNSSWLRHAVENNARWCEIVCASHGRPGEFFPGAWVNRQDTPRFYPNMVTLSPGHNADHFDQIRQLVDAEHSGTLASGWAVKDSFCNLDLRPMGLRPLFEAEWIYLPADLPLPSPHVRDIAWRRIAEPGELATWEAAWRGGETEDTVDSAPRIFLPSLMGRTDIAIAAGYQDDTIVTGAIANRTGDVVGISNLFSSTLDLRVGCVATVASFFPGLPMVGYESGADLAGMLALGFETLEPLAHLDSVRRRMTKQFAEANPSEPRSCISVRGRLSGRRLSIRRQPSPLDQNHHSGQSMVKCVQI